MTWPPNSEESIFNHAVDLCAAERNSYLDQACGNDAALRTRAEALLRAHDEAGDLLEAAPGGAVRAALAAPAPEEKPGTLIGRYTILQKIGEGGCGAVYMAEQQEPVVRRVALKVIKLGMDTKEVVARFEAERQALALMDHPNIARVLDAGATDQGRPFFVMELVRGIPITKYCDEQNLSIPVRLELFTQVCHAVQHAHQKGVIHRDLKPSNILVTVNDGVPVPKVIDFGIAKATQGRLTGRTLFTAFEQFIGTPAYMSPEQAEMSSVDVDTRSDIYSLGVLLYELLTGRTPFETTELLKAGLDEMRRRIREVEPPKPSTRLRALEAEALTTTALHHAIRPPRLIHLVRGDLDWIVMKCLEKDRRRRYETANGLAQDLAHFLADEPVSAAAPGVWYTLRKLTRRHRTFVFTAIGFALALIAVAGGSAVLAFRASRLERAAAEARMQAETTSRAVRDAAAVSHAVEEFLRTQLLAGGGGTRDETTLCDRLDRATAELRDRPPANHLVEIAIRENLAAGYRSLGLHTSLQQQLARIMELYRMQRGAADRQTIQASQNLQQALAEAENHPAIPVSPPPPVGPEPLLPSAKETHDDPGALPIAVDLSPPVTKPAAPENVPVLQPLVINLGTVLPHGTTQEVLLLRMAESWRVATNGKVRLKVFSDGRAGNESEMVTLIENRKLQAALMTVIGLEEIESGVIGLQKNTMGYSSLAEFDYIAEHLTPELEERLRRKGLAVLFWSDGGWMQLFSRRPVETPADLKALRLFMWAGRPAHVEIMRTAGFNPVPLEVGDYTTAFRNGLIDAASLPPFLALSYQIDSCAPHMLQLNSEPLIGVCIIRRETWDRIPAETREHLLAIARATGREITASSRRESDAAVVAMQKRNLTVHTVPAAAAAEWHDIAERFRPLVRGRIVDAAIYDRVQALIGEYRATHANETKVP